jgi:hypothetical protein
MKTTSTSKESHFPSRAILALLFSVFIAAAPFARASLIATDDFDSYVSGSTLVGGTGGTGWSGAWSGSGNYATVVSGPDNTITFTLDNGQIRGGGNALKITGPANKSRTINILERDIPQVSDGSDVYVSFIFKIKSEADDGTTFSDNNLVCWYAKDGVKSEAQDASGYAGYAGKLGARLAGGTPPTVSTPIVIGQTYFAVVRYSGWDDGVQAYDNCRVWLNPTTTDRDSTDASITAVRNGNSAGYGNTDIRGIYLTVEGIDDTSRYHIVDDIRVGQSWADVVGIPMPVVDTISPSSAMAGDSVTLAGKNLADVTVTIGGEAAVISAQNATSLTLTVPGGLSEGAHVMVITGAGGALTKSITILDIVAPVIDSVTPASGASGDSVVIAGSNFRDVSVTLGGLPVAVTSETLTQLTVTIPAGLANGSQTITVANIAGSDTIAFTNTAPTPTEPVAAGVDSPFYRPGATVTLTGSDLVGTVSVTVGGVDAEIVSRANGTLVFTIPDELALGDHTVVVTTAGGQASITIAVSTLVAVDNFDAYMADTTVIGGTAGTGWSAAWTADQGSEYVTIVGGTNSITYTLDNGQVRGGGNALKVTASSADETIGVLERAVPEITDGKDVFVSLIFKIQNESEDGAAFTDNNNIYYLAGDGAKSAAQDGCGFAGYAGKAGARLSSGRVTINNPIVTGQTYFLVIRYSGWDSGVQAYDTISTWLNPATIDEGAATTSGNNTSNDSTKAITREGNSANYGSTKFSSLYLNTLGLNSTTRFHVIDDIRIGRAWSDVVGVPMPVVDSISPTIAMMGSSVEITGKNLGDVTVTIGGEAAVITEQTATSLTFTVPDSLSKGTYDVLVAGPGGSVTKTITVSAPPIIDSVTPDNGVAGDTVVIAGLNFEAVSVSMGGLPVTIART